MPKNHVGLTPEQQCMAKQLRSEIGEWVRMTFVYARRGDRDGVRSCQRALAKLLGTGRTTVLVLGPEVPHPCPPTDPYPDMTDAEFETLARQKEAAGASVW
jgi:hypothetical protein